jgi:hypothetical protein
MKIVYSHWSNADILHQKLFPEMAAASNYLAQKQGFKTVLYTDSKGYELLHKINFNEFKQLDEKKLNQFPKTGWSLGKLLTISDIDYPFLHIDFDLFLLKPLDSKILSQDNLFLHREIWMDNVLKTSCKIIGKRPSLVPESNSYISYNCAIFGGQNYKTFNKAAQNICNFAIENSEFLESIAQQQRALKKENKVKHHLYLAMMLEQLWLPQITEQDSKINTILTNDKIKNLNEKQYYSNNKFYEKDDNIFEIEFKTYLKELNILANELGIIHFYASTKKNYKKKIIKFANSKNLTF